MPIVIIRRATEPTIERPEILIFGTAIRWVLTAPERRGGEHCENDANLRVHHLPPDRRRPGVARRPRSILCAPVNKARNSISRIATGVGSGTIRFTWSNGAWTMSLGPGQVPEQ
jgi:hypothetical protein